MEQGSEFNHISAFKSRMSPTLLDPLDGLPSTEKGSYKAPVEE